MSVGPERLARWLDGFAQRHGGFDAQWEQDRVEFTGADGDRATVRIPFPPLGESGVDALVAHVSRDRRVGALLVRRGGYAAGVFAGSELVASKVGSAYVQGTTKAGGWSQQRFARRRANQTRQAWGEAADTAAAVLLPHRGSLAALVCGGDATGVDAVLADPRLAPLRDLRTGPLLAVPDPRLRVLRELPEQFCAVAIDLDP